MRGSRACHRSSDPVQANAPGSSRRARTSACPGRVVPVSVTVALSKTPLAEVRDSGLSPKGSRSPNCDFDPSAAWFALLRVLVFLVIDEASGPDFRNHYQESSHKVSLEVDPPLTYEGVPSSTLAASGCAESQCAVRRRLRARCVQSRQHRRPQFTPVMAFIQFEGLDEGINC